MRRDRDRSRSSPARRSRPRRSGARAARRAVRARDRTPRLRADTLARLRRHRELGHTVVLASASFEPYLAPLGRLLGVDGVVCTRLELEAGRAAHGPARRRELPRPREGAARARVARDAGLADAELWAYGDSRGDAELLASADHPVWVDGHGARAGAPRLASTPCPDALTTLRRELARDHRSHGRRARRSSGTST